MPRERATGGLRPYILRYDWLEAARRGKHASTGSGRGARLPVKRLTSTLVLLAGLAGVGSIAFACGDKFLIVGRCVSYQRTHSAEHPGHVLILWSSNSKAAAAIRDVELQDFLQQAGHRVN